MYLGSQFVNSTFIRISSSKKDILLEFILGKIENYAIFRGNATELIIKYSNHVIPLKNVTEKQYLKQYDESCNNKNLEQNK